VSAVGARYDEDFSLPAQCNVIFEDGFESGDTSAWSATVG